MMNKYKSIIICLGLSLVSICLFFSAAEVIVRIFYPEFIPSTQYDWSLRHKGYSLYKPANTFRIVVLGDSYAFGQGVKRDETFPKRLESMLNRSYNGTRFEVINLGFCGLNTKGELEILSDVGINPETGEPDARYRGLAYNPDLVLMEYTLNDASTSGRLVYQIKEYDDMRRTGEVLVRLNSGAYSLPIPEFIDKNLTKNSRFYLLFLGRYNQILARMGLREAGESAVSGMLGRYKDDSIGWLYAKQALIVVQSVAKQHRLPVVLAVYPEMFRLNDYPFKEAHKKVLDSGNALGFHTLDLTPSFEGLEANSLKVTPFDSHPNAKAHDIAARSILEFLIKEKLVPSL